MSQHWVQPGLDLATDSESIMIQGSDALPFFQGKNHSLYTPFAITWVTSHYLSGMSPCSKTAPVALPFKGLQPPRGRL